MPTSPAPAAREFDVAVIGGGQAGLALGYYLRRTGLDFTILDAGTTPGGAWNHTWRSIRLFSPARFSSLPGWPMEGGPDHYPSRDEVLRYLHLYEERYRLPIERPVRVRGVTRIGERLVVRTGAEDLCAAAVVSATGTWENPVVPRFPGIERFRGVQVHSAHYVSPAPFAGRRVIVVGGGNSGAQIMAELSAVANATWVTLSEPAFLPDWIDGRYLFDEATALYRARQEGAEPPERPNLGDVVVVPPVRAARDRGDLDSVRPFTGFTPSGVVWSNGSEERVDAVVWCTGFRPALDHLRPLGLVGSDGRVRVTGTRAVLEPRLWLVGYGNWTGYASATLIGVGRAARSTVAEITAALTQPDGGAEAAGNSR